MEFEEFEKIKKERSKENKQKYINERINRIIPPKYKNYRLTEKEKKYTAKNIFMTGKSGAGKTVLCMKLAIDLLQHEKRVKICKYTSFVYDLQYKKDKSGGLEIRKFPGVLIIDEFMGVGRNTDFSIGIGYEILDYREQHMLPIIMNSNLSILEIKKIEPRIARRIIDIIDIGIVIHRNKENEVIYEKQTKEKN